MPVIPSPANLLQDQTSLHEFLIDCQATAEAKQQVQIVSLSLRLATVDPLALLGVIGQAAAPVHFYLEKPAQAEAIAAFAPILQRQFAGAERFDQAKQFLHHAQTNAIAAGDLDLPLAGPRFYCSFSFFDQVPADSPFPAATVFLPRWQVGCGQGQTVGVFNLLVSADSDLEDLTIQVWQDLQTIKAAPGLASSWSNHDLPQLNSSAAGAVFKAAVNAALESICSDRFSKLVLAHAVDVSLPQPVDLGQSLAQMRQHYPDCYIFCLGNGQGQQFIGASPERLISLQGQELITDALAGSAPRGDSLSTDTALAAELLSSDKDLREHQVIVDFIHQHLQQLQITPRRSPPPHLLQLANIQHLQTLITARVPAHLHLLDILAELHPTPAVAGAPRAIACEQIRRYENFDRHLYAAPLGWIDQQGNGEFIVGIRSALIDGCQTRLYAGAGIVAGSDPDKELAEINLKLQTLLSALVWGSG
ncbi:MAG: isochorismate synthase [Aphanocapsa sp. GSE-SYN-MK-11-07L]|jgi:menaquinone-specific isochorismate synthase|nr:isochorismate synthase [Aphanocapsa sp. GSE-SYN-MK-11-07L]